VQRVLEAHVTVDGTIIGSIKRGLLVLIGISRHDSEKEAHLLSQKICNLRIFPNELGKMAHSICDLNLELLLVSQFTLYGNVHSGRRPDFMEAASPELASILFDKVKDGCRNITQKIPQTGQFQAKMQVQLINDGPVTLWIDVEPKVLTRC